jgi:hypothetical protein
MLRFLPLIRYLLLHFIRVRHLHLRLSRTRHLLHISRLHDRMSSFLATMSDIQEDMYDEQWDDSPDDLQVQEQLHNELQDEPLEELEDRYTCIRACGHNVLQT